MKTMSEREDDLPKTIAVIISVAPFLVLRTGVAYLRTKRRIRKRAKLLMRSMVSNGLSPSLARRLADDFEKDLSIRNLVSAFTPNRAK